MNHRDGMMSWWMMGGWGWLWLLLAAVLIALLVWVLVRLSDRSAPPSGRTQPDDALRVLEERFARGEIDQDEFERRRAALRDDGI